MDGLGCTEMLLSQVRDANCRFDSEYYSKDNLLLQKTVNRAGSKTIGEYGGYLDCSAFYPSITEHYSKDRKNNIPFLRVNEICNGLIVLTTDTVFLPCDVIAKNSKTIALAYPGDIIIAKGGNTLAKVGLVPEDFPVYATCRDVVILRTNKLTGLNKYFLWAFLHCKYGQGILRRSASQTGQPHLTLPALLKIKVPDVVSLQELIGELYENTVTLKQGAESLFDGAAKYVLSELGFAAWSPSEKGTCEKKYLDVVATGRLDAEYFQPKYDEIEKRIRAYAGGTITAESVLVTGLVKESEEVQEHYVELADIGVNGEIGGCTVAAFGDLPSRARQRIRTGQVIASSIEGSLDCCALVTDEYDKALCSTGFHRFKSDEINPETMLLLFMSWPIQQLMKRGCSGTILCAILPGELAHVVLPVVDTQIQKKLAVEVQECFSLRSKSKALLECAKQAVEMAIEQGETAALDWLKTQIVS